MGRKRPGQVRFEAWVPEALYREFSERTANRALWLRRQMEGALLPPPAVTQPVHHHKRREVGREWRLGTEMPVFACDECGERL